MRDMRYARWLWSGLCLALLLLGLAAAVTGATQYVPILIIGTPLIWLVGLLIIFVAWLLGQWLYRLLRAAPRA